jgi:hypothetical protein
MLRHSKRESGNLATRQPSTGADIMALLSVRAIEPGRWHRCRESPIAPPVDDLTRRNLCVDIGCLGIQTCAFIRPLNPPTRWPLSLGKSSSPKASRTADLTLLYFFTDPSRRRYITPSTTTTVTKLRSCRSDRSSPQFPHMVSERDGNPKGRMISTGVVLILRFVSCTTRYLCAIQG